MCNARLIGGKGNAYQIIKNRWEKYESALAGTNDYSQWARPFLSPAQVDSLKKTKETAVFLALGDSIVNGFRTGIKNICNVELPEYAQPVEVNFIDSLPLTPIGKIDYMSLERN